MAPACANERDAMRKARCSEQHTHDVSVTVRPTGPRPHGRCDLRLQDRNRWSHPDEAIAGLGFSETLVAAQRTRPDKSVLSRTPSTARAQNYVMCTLSRRDARETAFCAHHANAVRSTVDKRRPRARGRCLHSHWTPTYQDHQALARLRALERKRWPGHMTCNGRAACCDGELRSGSG